MTREQLVKFLEETYEPDEQLVWQTICYEDLENGVEGATPQLWASFIESLDTYNRLAENFSDNAFSEFYGFVEENA
jgi:hypothetical protein